MVKFDWLKILVSTNAPSRQVYLLLKISGHVLKIWLRGFYTLNIFLID